jgi:hypothetical protein
LGPKAWGFRQVSISAYSGIYSKSSLGLIKYALIEAWRINAVCHSPNKISAAQGLLELKKAECTKVGEHWGHYRHMFDAAFGARSGPVCRHSGVFKALYKTPSLLKGRCQRKVVSGEK